MAILRRVRVAIDPAPRPAVAQPKRRRVIPIAQAVEPGPTPAELRRQQNAYVAPEGEEKADTTDYKAIEQRYLDRIKNPLTAIRARCVQCCCGQVYEVAHCTVQSCALHPFRMGENPNNLRTKAKNAGLSLDEYKAQFGAGEDE